MKKSFKILACVGIFFVLNSVCKGRTDDFAPRLLLKASPTTSEWNQSYLDETLPLEAVLAQKFTYLGKGKQAHAFSSEDGIYVLKVFKPPAPIVWFSLFGKKHKVGLSKIPFAQSIFSALHREECDKQRELDFRSCVNAFNLLREETGLMYLHLAETADFRSPLEIYDKIGVRHYLDANKTCFLIQKKADLFYPVLRKMIRQGDLESAKILIEGYVNLSMRCIERGIVNPTTVENNIGCISLQPIFFDTGRVLRKQDLNPDAEDLSVSVDQIDKSTHHMKTRLLQEAPYLASFLEELVTTKKTPRSPAHDPNS